MKTRKEFLAEEIEEYMGWFNESPKSNGEKKWQEAEEAFQEKYSRPKYTSYGSFRIGKMNYINDLRDKVRSANSKRKV